MPLGDCSPRGAACRLSKERIRVRHRSDGTEYPACSCVCATGTSHDGYWRSFETDALLSPVEQTATGTTFTTGSVTGDGVDPEDAELSGYTWAATTLT